MSKATEELVDALHGLTAQSMIDLMEKYNSGQVRDKDGEPIPLPASVLAAATKFLKDNGVDRPGKSEKAVDALADLLPDVETATEFVRETH